MLVQLTLFCFGFATAYYVADICMVVQPRLKHYLIHDRRPPTKYNICITNMMFVVLILIEFVIYLERLIYLYTYISYNYCKLRLKYIIKNKIKKIKKQAPSSETDDSDDDMDGPLT